jgi:hypothetical protein
MFIILGSPRSGTTLLKETLNLNSSIFVPHETDFIVPMAFIIDRIENEYIGKELIEKLIIGSKRYTYSLRPYLDEIDISSALKEAEYTLLGMLRSIYSNLARKVNKIICGDKSPNDLLDVQILQNLGLLDSDIKIVHIVRDIRGVVSSLLNVDWSPNNIEFSFPRQWNHTNLHLHQAMEGKFNYFFIRYEDMIADPKKLFTEVTKFLGVGFEDSMLNELNRGISLQHLQYHRNLASPFLASRSNAWKSELPTEIIKYCEKSAFEGLDAFGYFESGGVLK